MSHSEIAKSLLLPLFLGFKVIDVGIPKKLVASGCYDKQHVCLSATIFTLDEAIAVE